MNPKNKVTPKERVKEMAKALSDRGKGYLVIKCEFFKFMSLCRFNTSLIGFCSGKTLSKSVYEGASALIDVISHLPKQDASRLKKGIEFLNAKYPHAVFFFHEYVLGVANLTPEEIEDCLSQIGIDFGYYQVKSQGHED